MKILLPLIAVFSLSVHALNIDGLDPKIRSFLKIYEPVADTGVAVAVIHKGQVVFFQGYGLRDRANRLPVTDRTLFRIGSITKSLTSTSLAILADEGKLRLDQKVSEFLPDFALAQSRAAHEATLKDLLSHRVGLPRHDALWYFTPFTREALFQKLSLLEMNPVPGYGFRGKWQYNNLMYMVLGMVGEKASGETWDQLIRNKILSPLQMDETGFSAEDMARSSDFARPYLGDTELPYLNYEAIGPAGIAVSNVRDLSKWVALYLNQGRSPTGERLVSEQAQRDMFSTESEDEFPAVGIRIQYGLGWFIHEIAGRKLVWHGGNIDGFSAHVSFMPDDDVGLIVLANQTAGSNLQLPYLINQNGEEYKLLPLMIYEHVLGVSADRSLNSKTTHLPNELLVLGDRRLPGGKKVQSLQLFNVGKGLGTLTNRAYGEVSLSEDVHGVLRLRYYRLEGELKATPETGKYQLDVEGDLVPVEIRKRGAEIDEVSVHLEPAVKAIVFTRGQDASRVP